MTNLWHDLETGPRAPEIIYAIVEIPRGHRNKYEFDKELGFLKLDRVLYSPLHYPGEYGLIPRTYAEDGDPLDVLIIMQEPTFPGCVIRCRPIGLLNMLDGGERDTKILAVPEHDPLYGDVKDLDDIPSHFKREVSHFFQTYKELEAGKVDTEGWDGASAAFQAIRESQQAYMDHFSNGRS